MYLSQAGSLYGANKPIYPSSYPTGDYCGCGQRKAPGDFLCDECRDALDDYYRSCADEESTIYTIPGGSAGILPESET